VGEVLLDWKTYFVKMFKDPLKVVPLCHIMSLRDGLILEMDSYREI
jgi:hypothetical protein